MEIYKKLFTLQQSIDAVKKDSTNPYFNSAYFDINKLVEVLKPKLAELNLVILQPTIVKENKNLLQTLIIDTETGDKIESEIELPSNIEPQKMGSAITYFRRYCLQSLLFLEAEDDDGSKASPKNTNNYTPQQQTKTVSKPVDTEDIPF